MTIIRQAMADGAFQLHYQPVVNLRSDAIVGCEALLRWHHPVRGMIRLPSLFRSRKRPVSSVK
jgi:EAL domain-containing protein (putative c-di-GMP-specific phosphodiesterase class I)